MRIAISGGGTGGGVYPALAVASALSPRPPKETTDLLWIGGVKGPERDLATRAGIAFRAVTSGPIAGVGLWALLAPFLIGWGLLQSLAILARFKPDALLITGGWVTIPPALACWLMRIPIMIYCPDIEPGGTLRILQRIATRIGVVSPDSAKFYPRRQVVDAGYPVRPELLGAAGFDLSGEPVKNQDHVRAEGRKQAYQEFGLDKSAPILLIFGGSTGARSINKAVVACLGQILDGWQVIHVTGRLDSAWVEEAASRLPPQAAARYHRFDYLHSQQMALALAAADLTLARSGASALGEFPLFGLPAILVPYPYAWRYQKTNADMLATRGAAIRLDDDTLGDELLPTLTRLLDDAAAREQMAEASASLRRPDAAARLAAALADMAHRTYNG